MQTKDIVTVRWPMEICREFSIPSLYFSMADRGMASDNVIVTTQRRITVNMNADY